MMYFALGTTLALAAFLLLNVCFCLGAHLLVPLVRKTASLRPRVALFFVLRIFPACAAILCTFLLVIPSYLSLEPRGTAERMGWLLPLLAALSAWVLAAAWFGALASWRRSHLILRDWLRKSEAISLPGVSIPAYRLQETFPVVAVIGAFRPRLFVSGQVLEALNAEEFAAAIQHEMGHLDAHDNLRRWLARLCPPSLPFLPGARRLAQLWHAASEESADNYAVREGKATPLDLASALIKVSRMVPVRRPMAIPAGAYLLEQQDLPHIARRVHALLEKTEGIENAQSMNRTSSDRASTSRRRRIALVGVSASAMLLLAVSYPSLLLGVHEALEKFLHLVS